VLYELSEVIDQA
jgi:hypothetical protein